MNFNGFEIIKVENGVVIKAYTAPNESKNFVAKDFQDSVTVLQGLLNGQVPAETTENAN
jgi:hypothetical protein